MMTPKDDKSIVVGIAAMSVIAGLFLLLFILSFRELAHDGVSILIYFLMTSVAALVLLRLLSRKRISGKNVLLAIPLTMVILLVLLVLLCRWEGGTEGLVLVSPAWLGGFTQGGPALSLKSEMPSKFNELVSKVFSYEALLGESVYVCTLFYWLGLIVWIASVSILRLISGKPKKTIRYL